MLHLGLIGCGAIARTHASNIVNKLKGAEITGVYDLFPEAAEGIVAEFNLSAKIFDSSDALIQSNEVDAVLVCSKYDAHVEPILSAIAALKPVFTEKPLARTAEECLKIIEAEAKAGKRLVQAGFMRRFDPYFNDLKDIMDSGIIGEPLLGYCRSFTTKPATDYFTDEMMITDAYIHEIDDLHWLFNDDYEFVQVYFPKSNSLSPIQGLRDPQVAVVKMKNGAFITTYITQNANYGYEVTCQIIGEKGIAELPDRPTTNMRVDGKIYRKIDMDWSNRFNEAYENEIQAFIDQVSKQEPLIGPSAWDGYIASVVSDSAVQSQKTQRSVQITLAGKPALYEK